MDIKICDICGEFIKEGNHRHSGYYCIENVKLFNNKYYGDSIEECEKCRELIKQYVYEETNKYYNSR